MWLLGMIAGAVIGALGGAEGALAGAAAGLMAGIALRRRDSSADEAWKRETEAALQRLRERVAVLEGAEPGVPTGAAAAATAADAMPAESPQAAPAEQAADAAAVAPLAAPLPTAAADPATADAGAATAVPVAPARENPVVRWLFGGNTLVRVGVVVLFFGVAFLLKYAAERDLVPIELRLAGVALGGAALLVVGWRLRSSRAGYALMLQGGGVGVLYLTVFAGLRLYSMLPAELAFGLLVGVAVFSSALAILQDSPALAVTGVAGGFLAPLLASTGAGSHVALFSFYAVLNAGVVGIAHYKAWRVLNLVGFGFTFVIGLLWGVNYYRPAFFASTEPFLVLFFLFYVAVAVLFAARRSWQLAHYVDGTIVFGTPLVAFGLQVALVRDIEFGAAWSAFALAAFYLTLATVLRARQRENLRLLVESFVALGVGFATLAIPLAFDGRWTSAAWAVEGAAIAWIGVRQGRMLPRVCGMLLQPAAGFAFLAGADGSFGTTPILNSLCIGAVMVSVAALFISRYLEARRHAISEEEAIVARLIFIWGALWWFGGGLAEIERHAPGDWGWHPHLLFLSGSCGAFGMLWRKLDWNMARLAALANLPLMAAIAVALLDRPDAYRHPFADHAYAGWALAFALHLWLLRRHEGHAAGAGRWIDWYHAAGFWLLALILSWETGWQIDHYVEGRRVWPLVAWALIPGALLAILAARGARLGWPVAGRQRAYLYAGAAPLAVFLCTWVIYANFRSSGDPAPLPYVPLVNPLDLAQGGALLALVAWYRRLRVLQLPGARLPAGTTALRLLGALAFIALNGVLLRTLHHYADVPFRVHALWRSDLVQACFSLLWSLLALTLMVFAARRALRALWMTGAVLLAVVVAKLFLIDLANTGTVERVVSFIGVGILVIVVGYFSPVPPRSRETTC